MIGLGAAKNDGTGEDIRDGGVKINAMFAELYGHVGLIKAPYRPENYGALFDGTTDDTAAWSAMFADIAAAGWGEVVLPRGMTRVNANVLNVPNSCQITGAGRSGTQIKRLAGTGPLLDASGTASGQRKFRVHLEDFGLDNNGENTGPLFRSVYGSEHKLANLRFDNSIGPAMQIVETWDSNYDFLFSEWCGQGTVASTNNGSTIGTEVLQLWGSIAASGFGSGGDSNNNLNFNNVRLETFRSSAVSIRKGPTASGTSNAQIRFNGCKFETGGTFEAQYVIDMSGDVRGITFRDTYLAAISAAGAFATSGTMRFVNLVGNSFIIFDTTLAWLSVPTAFDCCIRAFTDGTNRVDHFRLNGSAPTGAGGGNAIIRVDGGANIPYTNVGGISGLAVAATSPAYSADNTTSASIALTGTQAFQVQPTDSSTLGGNARGSNAADLQSSRTAASQVASGAGAAVIGRNKPLPATTPWRWVRATSCPSPPPSPSARGTTWAAAPAPSASATPTS